MGHPCGRMHYIKFTLIGISDRAAAVAARHGGKTPRDRSERPSTCTPRTPTGAKLGRPRRRRPGLIAFRRRSPRWTRVHYLDGAPCLQSSVNDKKVAVDGLEHLGALDEQQWPLHARTGAAAGVAVSSRARPALECWRGLGWPRPPTTSGRQERSPAKALAPASIRPADCRRPGELMAPVSALRPSNVVEPARTPAAAAGPAVPERCRPAPTARRPAAPDAASAQAASRRTARRTAPR